MSEDNTHDTSGKKKKIIATVIVGILVIGSFLIWTYSGKDEKFQRADLGDLLASRSVRKGDADAFIVSGESAFFALAATPAACYYNDSQVNAVPLLVEVDQPDSVLDPLERFYDAYRPESMVVIGNADDHGYRVDRTIKTRCPKTASLEIATNFWESSDGAILVKHDLTGYEVALWAGPLASYIDIPIIVADGLTSEVKDVLNELGVKYTITCGDIKGYGKVMEVADMESMHNITLSYMSQGLGLKPDYVVLANPLDSTFPEVEESFQEEFHGEVFHVYSTGAYAGLEQMSKGVDFDIEVPADYVNSVMHLELSYSPHEQDEVDGERIYVFVLWENPEGEQVQKCYFGTPAGYKDNNREIVEFDVPILNCTGKYTLHVEGRMTYEGVPVPYISEKPVAFDMSARVDNLASPVYPLMEKLSSLAPYLAAYRQGLVMAKQEYALQFPGYSGCTDCAAASGSTSTPTFTNGMSELRSSNDVNRKLSPSYGAIMRPRPSSAAILPPAHNVC